jgi:hypothetical protein
MGKKAVNTLRSQATRPLGYRSMADQIGNPLDDRHLPAATVMTQNMV